MLAIAVWLVRDILLLTLSAVIFALLLTTPVRFLMRFGLRRSMAVLLTVLLVLIVLILGTALLLPALIDQFKQLVIVLQRALDPGTYTLAIPTLDSYQLTIILRRAAQSNSLGINLDFLRGTNISALTQQLSSQLLSTITNLPSQVFPFVGSLASVLLSVLVILFMGLYFVGDPEVYVSGTIRLFPKPYRNRAREVAGKLEVALRNYLQAQVLLMLLTGVSTSIMLALLGIPLPGALGTITGLLSFIPNFGPLISLGPILAVVLLNEPSKLLTVIAVYYGFQLIFNQLLAPLLVGQEINLPPVVVLLAQIIAGVFFGFLGLLLSVPLAAVATVLVREIYIRDILGDTGDPERLPPSGQSERAGAAALDIAIAPKTTG
jgi:predicted PurR-regulated permease PerM